MGIAEPVVACLLVLSGVAFGLYGLRRQSKLYYLGLILILLPLAYLGYLLYGQYKLLRAAGATVSIGPGLQINVTYPTINMTSVQFDILKPAADAGTLTAQEVASFITSDATMTSQRSRLAEDLVQQPWVKGVAADAVINGLIQSWPAWMPESGSIRGTIDIIFASSKVPMAAKERLLVFLTERGEDTPGFSRYWLQNLDTWSMVLPISADGRKKAAASQAGRFSFKIGDGNAVRAGSVVPVSVGATADEQNMRFAQQSPPFQFSAKSMPGDVEFTAPLSNRIYHGISVLTWTSNVIAPTRPGKYKIQAEFQISRSRDDIYSYFWRNAAKRPVGLLIDKIEPVTATRIISGEFEVIANDAVLEHCTTAEDSKLMAAAIRQSSQGKAYLTKNGVEVDIIIKVKPESCSLVCDVILIEGGQEFMLGTHTAVQGEEATWQMGRDGVVNSEGRSFLKFVPRPDILPYSMRATRIYAGEPILKEIQLFLYGSR